MTPDLSHGPFLSQGWMGLVFLTSPALAGGYMVPRQKLGYSPGIRKWMGGRGTITMSLNVADILLKFDIDLIQINKPRNETKLNFKI